jgi:uncharacterized protein (TIGR03435 family)
MTGFGRSRTLTMGGIVLAGMMGVRAQSQPLVSGPQFEVASVRQAAAGSCGNGAVTSAVFKVDAARVDIRCLTLGDLIEDAFGILGNRLTRPDWTWGSEAPRFDIAAKLPQGASEDQVPAMLQALLADRFKLAVHRETREPPGYALVVAKGGLKVVAAAANADASDQAGSSQQGGPRPPVSGMVNLNGVHFRWTILPNPTGNGYTELLSSPRMGTVRDSWNPDGTRETLDAPDITFEGIADLVTVRMGQPIAVVDMTGVKGRYQAVLDVSYSALLSPPGRPASMLGQVNLSSYVSKMQFRVGKDQDIWLDAFQTALKKLGLRLEQRNVPVEMIVVDHLERTPTEN